MKLELCSILSSNSVNNNNVNNYFLYKEIAISHHYPIKTHAVSKNKCLKIRRKRQNMKYLKNITKTQLLKITHCEDEWND